MPISGKRVISAADLSDEVGEIVDLLVDGIDLLKDQLRVRRRKIAAVLAREEADAERALGIFDEPADARRRDVEEFRGTADRSRNHHGANDFYLSQRHHRQPR